MQTPIKFSNPEDVVFERKINDPANVKFENDQFIGIWDNIFLPDFCEKLIYFYEKTDHFRYDERTRRHDTVRVDRQIDLQIFEKPLNDHIFDGLGSCLKEYLDWYPVLQPFHFYTTNNLFQKTQPKQGYHSWHHEKCDQNTNKRTLVWMVYMNDVDEGGETEFLYQQKKIKPKTGRVVIFPASFTHQHRGNPPMSNKYIITGWLSSQQAGHGLPYFEYKPNNP